MSKKVIIWPLNAAVNLLEKEVYLNQIFGKRGKDWDYGERKYNNKTTKNLMPDEEYFVPIAVKCLGDKLNDNDNIITNIKNYYYNIWKQEDVRKNTANIYETFWNIGCGPLKNSKMYTDKYMGYYEILENAGKNNILVGYSQGGLVAKFLGYLDEYIYKKNIIKGIITVQSSNFGSPFANPVNKDDFVDGILQAFLSLISFYKDNFNELILYFKNFIQFSNIDDILKLILKGIKNMNVPDDISEKTKNDALDFMSTIIKWLSGLNGDVDTAFYDLNISLLDKTKTPYSVLSLSNNYQLNNIYYGSVISSNNDLEAVINSFLKEFLSGLVKIAVKSAFKKIEILDKTLQTNFLQATKTFKNEIMVESNNNFTFDLIKEIIKYYNNGMNNVELNNYKIENSDFNKKKHDFLIPSAYQLSVNNEKNNFMGNKINTLANHNSGKALKFTAGWKNLTFIKQFLREMKSKCQFE